MATIPLVNVVAHLVDQQGVPISGATVRMKLSTIEKYQGLVVPREVSKVTDANGDACLQVFPNELGTEGSEYDVHITGSGVISPTDSSRCGCTSGTGTFRTLRFSVVVPNSDCNLFDIANLPPYEQRGMGATLPSEVAGYAYNAAESATQAKNYADSARQVSDTVSLKLQAIEATQEAASAAADKAETAAEQAKDYSDGMKDISRHFETVVTEQTDAAVREAIADAAACLQGVREAAINAIEQERTDALNEISSLTGNARKAAIEEINNKASIALAQIDRAFTQAKEELREMAAQYDEDFEALVARAEANAKKSACAASSAASSAEKACSCATRAETAAKEAAKLKDDTYLLAVKSEQAYECIKSIQNILNDLADKVDNQFNQTKEFTNTAKQAAQQANTSQDAAQNAAESAAKSANFANEQANIVLDNIDAIQKNTKDLQDLDTDIKELRDFVQDVNTENHTISAQIKEDRRATGLARNDAQKAAEDAEASAHASQASADAAADSRQKTYDYAVKVKQREQHVQEMLDTVENDLSVVEEDTAYVRSVAEDVTQAIVNKAESILTDELKTDVRAQALRAEEAADRAEETAAQVAEDVSAKLAVINIHKEFATLSDRVFRLENGLPKPSPTDTGSETGTGTGSSGTGSGSGTGTGTGTESGTGSSGTGSGGTGSGTDTGSSGTGYKVGDDPETDDRNNPDSTEYYADIFSDIFKNKTNP